MKTSKMIMGFAFVGLLLLCSAVFAQTTTPPADAEQQPERGFIQPSSSINDGVGVLISPNVTQAKEYPGVPGAPKQTITTPANRQVPLPSYATANVTTITTPSGATVEFKVPSSLDSEPAYIDTGNPLQDMDNYAKALDEYFGTEEYSEIMD